MCEKFLHPKIWQANMKKLLIALTFLPGCVPELRINWHEQDVWSDRLTRKEQQQTERTIAELSAVTWAVGPWVAVRQLANRGRVHGLDEARPNVS